MSSRIKNSSINIVFSLINKVVMLILPFVVRTILIYSFGINYAGLNGLFTSILSVLSLAELGFGSALVVNMYKPVAEADNDTISKVLGYYKNIYFWIGCSILMFGIIILPFLSLFIQGDTPGDINLYVLFLIYLSNTVISYLFFGYSKSLFIANQRSDIVSKISIIFNIVMYMIQILALVTLKNYYIYAIILPITTMANNIVCHFVSKRIYPDICCKPGLDDTIKKDVMNKTKVLIGHKIGGLIANSFDSITISAFLGLIILGKYNNYHCILAGIFGIVSAITSVVVPSVANSTIKRDLESNLKDYNTFNIILNIFSIVCCSCLFCLYQPFVKLWVGEENLLSLFVVVLLTVYFFINCSRQVTLVYKDALGLWKEDCLRPYIEAGVNLLLNIILVNIIGLEGVIIATIISMAFVTLPWEVKVLYKHYFKCSSKSYFIWLLYNLLVTILSVIVSFYACSLISIEGVMGFILKAILIMGISLLMGLLSYCWTSRFKDALIFFKRVKNQVLKSK